VLIIPQKQSSFSNLPTEICLSKDFFYNKINYCYSNVTTKPCQVYVWSNFIWKASQQFLKANWKKKEGKPNRKEQNLWRQGQSQYKLKDPWPNECQVLVSCIHHNIKNFDFALERKQKLTKWFSTTNTISSSSIQECITAQP
jgi:hypothetical protein